MRATSVGPDLSRVFVRIEKPSYTGPTTGDAPAPAVTSADASDEAPSAGDDTPVQSGDSTALPLSA
jgi:single-strand DNA-binding protein